MSKQNKYETEYEGLQFYYIGGLWGFAIMRLKDANGDVKIRLAKCKKKKDLCICERRIFVKVDEKFQKEPIWMIWDVLFQINSTSNNEISKKILKSLFELFCIRYTSGAKRKRKYLIYSRDYGQSLLHTSLKAF